MGKFKRPLQALLSADLRHAQRHTLRLAASTQTESGATNVLIHDLSENGLSFETGAVLNVGETVLVDLPFIGPTEGAIVWNDGSQFGCEFLEPISNSTLSAALLRAPGSPQNDNTGIPFDEIPIGIKPSLDEITEWKVEFEQSQVPLGYRLVGFRQTPEGVLIAMLSKTN